MAEIRGSLIGGYRVLNEIGRGGMGVVLLAEDAQGRKVALKVVSQQLSTNAEFMARFRREGKALAAISHENVVGFLESGEEGGSPYLVFEHVPGGDLKAEIKRRGHLEWREAASLGARIARGLAAVHEAGLIHRDLKPENVLLTDRGEPRISDFGLVGAQASSMAVSNALTKTGELVGTLAYMAPEQAEASGKLSAKTDLYSLGGLLYFMLTGGPPFKGTGYELVKKHLVDVPRSPRELAPDIPARLEKLVLSLLAKKPEQRPESAEHVAIALESISREKERGGSPALVVGAALLLALGIGLGSWAFFRETNEPDREAKPAPSRMPTTRPTSSEPGALELARRAEDRLKRGDYAEALAEASKAIELDPKLGRAWTARAGSRLAMNDLEGGLADAIKAVELSPGSALAWSVRGSARAKHDQFDAAIYDCTKAIELDPKLAQAWADRGEARLINNEVDPAIQDLSRSIELDPKLVSAWVNRCFARWKKGDNQGVIADANQAMALDPKARSAWNNRGLARANMGDIEGAISDFSRAIEIDPTEPSGWQNRGAMRATRHDFENAIADFSKVIELDPKSANAYRSRAMARRDKGDIELARADFQRCLALAPDDPQAKQLLEKLPPR